MSTSRARELWRHRETGERWLVELEDDRVVSASGPLAGDELGEDALAFKEAAHGRTPAYDSGTADLARRRAEFERERVEGS